MKRKKGNGEVGEKKEEMRRYRNLFEKEDCWGVGGRRWSSPLR